MPGTAEELGDLAELRGLCMAAARRCAAAQATAEAPEQIAVLTLALDRAARAVRHIIVLEQQCRGARPLPHARPQRDAAVQGSAAGPGGRAGRPRAAGQESWAEMDDPGPWDDADLDRLNTLLDRVAQNHGQDLAEQAAARGEPVPEDYDVPTMQGEWHRRPLPPVGPGAATRTGGAGPATPDRAPVGPLSPSAPGWMPRLGTGPPAAPPASLG
ncbi:hypothetical protein [Zavarzinia sp. CC-PAN008]|uniref:hypothetical protein n=1 Tax=Zavarzinia sp. CC-PAN008 TaxID=3243332 RepID=UPI003F7463FE